METHIAVSNDFKRLHKDLDLTDWNISGHNWALGKRRKKPSIINKRTWFDLDENLIKKFNKKYGKYLSQFDAFFCGHSMPFLLIYEQYDKPIFGWNACRYDLPFCYSNNVEMLDIYNKSINRMMSSGQLNIVANNKADKDYFKLGAGEEINVIPSICDYTNIKSTPTYNKFYWYSQYVNPPFDPKIAIRSGRFKWSELQKYKAIIHIPYEISTMSMYEHYTAGIPLLVPTKNFLRKLWVEGAQWGSVSAYWTDDNLPNNLNPVNNMDFWLDRADFYDMTNMPYMYYFDSFDHLKSIINDFEDVYRDERIEFIKSKRMMVKESWFEILNKNIII